MKDQPNAAPQASRSADSSNPAPAAAAPGDDARDAARWRKLLACSRIRVLGYARGGPQGKDGPIRHIGFDFTNGDTPYCDTEIQEGRELLTTFTDSLQDVKRGIVSAIEELAKRTSDDAGSKG